LLYAAFFFSISISKNKKFNFVIKIFFKKIKKQKNLNVKNVFFQLIKKKKTKKKNSCCLLENKFIWGIYF